MPHLTCENKLNTGREDSPFIRVPLPQSSEETKEFAYVVSKGKSKSVQVLIWTSSAVLLVTELLEEFARLGNLQPP